MHPKFKIEKAKPIDYDYHSKYSFEDYTKKIDYNWLKYECKKYDSKTKEYKTYFLTNKKIDLTIIIHHGEVERYDPFNEYSHLSKKHYSYGSLSLKLAFTIHFKKFKSFELFEILAILENEQPFIDFDYFKIGEKYGYDKSTIVKYDNKIVKYFYIIENNKKYSFYDYYQNYKSIKSQSEISKIVDDYLSNLDFELEILYENLIANEESYQEKMLEKKYTIEDSYNDGGGGKEWSDPSEFW